jgi:hypothetical protein
MKIGDLVIDTEMCLINAKIIHVCESEIIVREQYSRFTLDITYKAIEFQFLKVRS